MQHPSYGSPSSFPSEIGSRIFPRYLPSWHKISHYGQELPAWSIGNPKELIVTRKRPWRDSQPNENSKRLAFDRLTLVPGTFTPVVIVNDDDCLDPVVPRKIDRSGRSWDRPLVVDEGLTGPAMTGSSAQNPHEFRHAMKDLRWSDASTKRIARKPSGRTPSSSNVQQSAALTSAYLPKANLQESFEYTNSAASDISISPTGTHSAWINRRYHPYLPREHRSTSLPMSLKKAQDFTPRSTLQGAEGDSGPWSDGTVTTPIRRSVVKDRLPIEERKAFFIHTPTSALTSAMSRFVAEVYAALPSFREEDECWLHPSPPRGYGRPKGCLSRLFYWTDEGGRHKLDINFGIIALIVDSCLTEKQEEGWITNSWHLSHLCGNWTCCNWRHFTVEPGKVNISRNACFMYRSGCVHEPQCMKEKKQRLSQVARATELKTEVYHTPHTVVEHHEHSSEAQDWPASSTDTISWDTLKAQLTQRKLARENGLGRERIGVIAL